MDVPVEMPKASSHPDAWAASPADSVLVLAIGNLLLSDDGAGIHLANILSEQQKAGRLPSDVTIRDGGTIGLTLLTEIDARTDFVALDAMELNEPPGTVRWFEGEDMDRQLTGRKKTAHEVALADLLGAARLSGCLPFRRGLLAIQPETTQWGLSPTPAVAAALPAAAEMVTRALREWRHDR